MTLPSPTAKKPPSAGQGQPWTLGPAEPGPTKQLHPKSGLSTPQGREVQAWPPQGGGMWVPVGRWPVTNLIIHFTWKEIPPKCVLMGSERPLQRPWIGWEGDPGTPRYL